MAYLRRRYRERLRRKLPYCDMSQLDLSGKWNKPEGVVFAPRSLAKYSRQGKPVTEFFPPPVRFKNMPCGYCQGE
jgi:hypothetical protein